MEGGHRRRDFAQDTISTQPRTPEPFSPQRQPVTTGHNSTLLRPDQGTRPPLRHKTSRPSIRLSRVPSAQNVARLQPLQERQDAPAAATTENTGQSGRRRSFSDPQRTSWPPAGDNALGRSATRTSMMEPLQEETTGSQGRKPAPEPLNLDPNTNPNLLAPPTGTERPNSGMLRRASVALGSAIGFGNRRNSTFGPEDPDAPTVGTDNVYDHQMVDLLDVVDPEVSTLSTLTNVQNSLFVPDLGNLLNRRPTYTFTRRPTGEADVSPVPRRASVSRRQPPTTAQPIAPIQEVPSEPTIEKLDTTATEEGERPDLARTSTLATIKSTVQEGHYAVKPQNFSFEGWSAEDKAEIEDHVRHMLHSRRSKFKRGWRGFKQYVKKPLGLFVTIYATLITLFGLAWVLFLIGWISVGSRQLYIINIIDNILVALFAIIGDGLAPFRAVDTYHMIFIAHYHHLTWRLRKEKSLPKLQDQNDLPEKRPDNLDVEAIADNVDAASIAARNEEKEELTVLNPKQQAKLEHHQNKFSKSHTFYKPHETETHHAFPLRLLVAVVVLLDCHSLLQIALGTCTWSISYHVRPFALTTVILCCSITCNIVAGITISIGDRMTRKKDVIERMFRQELTERAIHKLEKRKEKENKRNKSLDDTLAEETEPDTPGASSGKRDPMARASMEKSPVPGIRFGRRSLSRSLPGSPMRAEHEAEGRNSLSVMDRPRPVERTVYEGT